MKKSAGILLYRFNINLPEVLLVHPGGPYWAKKDLGAWSVPKGEAVEKENLLHAAIRELEEETGIKISEAQIELTPVKQKGGKVIYMWAVQRDVDTAKITSNTFEMEWPPRSGKFQSFPEADKGEWFLIDEAKKKINAAQVSLLTELEEKSTA